MTTDTGVEPTTRVRWISNAPGLATGGVWIVAGGIAAAVTGPTEWDHGSWVAAFLVLVAGVAQIGLAAGQAHLAPVVLSGRFIWAGWVLWNLGCVTVVAGTLLSSPLIVSIGSAALVATLAMSMYAVRGSQEPRLLLLLAYRLLLTVLIVSIPIGITLSWMRH